MNSRVFTAIAALGCVLLASCYPYDEHQNKHPNTQPPQKTVSTADQQKLKEQREKSKAEDELKKQAETSVPDTTVPTNPGGTVPTPPVEEKRTDTAVALKAPGREGYVLSPFNNKLIDVRGIPSGTLVADPTYPESAKKHFRVP